MLQEAIRRKTVRGYGGQLASFKRARNFGVLRQISKEV